MHAEGHGLVMREMVVLTRSTTVAINLVRHEDPQMEAGQKIVW